MSDTIHDDFLDESDSNADSSIEQELLFPGILKIHQTGELTVVGFGGEDFPEDYCVAAYRDQLITLIADHKVKVLAFDLAGVKLVPSGLLGLLASLRKRVDRIELYNISDDVREVLEITRLAHLFHEQTTGATAGSVEPAAFFRPNEQEHC